MHFYCKKLLVARNWGFNRPPWRAEDIKCMWVENIAGVQHPLPLHPLSTRMLPEHFSLLWMVAYFGPESTPGDRQCHLVSVLCTLFIAECTPGLEKTREFFGEKVFGFRGFDVKRRPEIKLRPRKNILYIYHCACHIVFYKFYQQNSQISIKITWFV